MDTSLQDRGIWYMPLSWVLLTLDIIVVFFRLYSRFFLTRSAGSDDFAITIALVSIPPNDNATEKERTVGAYQS